MIASPGAIAPSGSAGGLGEELVRPLGGALVRQVEGDVGRDDADERDIAGMSRPFVTRVVPTRMSSRPAANASITRSAAPRRSTTSRSSRPTRRSGKRRRTSSSTRCVPPPR